MGGLVHINWLKAFQYYCTDETISYPDVAKKFGVSLVAVKSHGAEEDWVKLRTESLQKAYQYAADKIAKKEGDRLASTNETHGRIGRLLQQKALEQIEKKEGGIVPKGARDVKEWIDTGVNIERKSLGMDRISNQTQVNIQNNNYMTLSDFMKALQVRKDQQGENIVEAQSTNE